MEDVIIIVTMGSALVNPATQNQVANVMTSMSVHQIVARVHAVTSVQTMLAGIDVSALLDIILPVITKHVMPLIVTALPHFSIHAHKILTVTTSLQFVTKLTLTVCKEQLIMNNVL